MKGIFLVLVAVFVVAPIFGQTAVTNQKNCTEETVKEISSRGIKLGMNRKDILNLFAENEKLTAVNYEFLPNENRNKISFVERDLEVISSRLQDMISTNFGFSSVSLIPKDKTNFDGISHYDFSFLDDRLAFFRVFYTKPKWENQEQFIRKMSGILNLPVEESNFDNLPYKIRCGNYKVEFGIAYDIETFRNMIVSTDIDDVLNQRRKKAEDEQREKDIKAFRP